MTPNDFRRIALDLSEVTESSHMGHADFRVGGRIFATLGWPDESHGMVKLPLELQELLCKAEPAAFRRIEGAWGKRGATQVVLKSIDELTLRSALTAAWKKAHPARLT